MEWIKIEDKLPDFEVVVLLYEKTEEKNLVSLGYLSSISKTGNRFIQYKVKNISSIFGEAFGDIPLTPTHWTPIKLPTEETEE